MTRLAVGFVRRHQLSTDPHFQADSRLETLKGHDSPVLLRLPPDTEQRSRQSALGYSNTTTDMCLCVERVASSRLIPANTRPIYFEIESVLKSGLTAF
ncbi:unnamed protein product [Protopolystoma xenopodis]|uniref:Uncharacterized protein n=1 Tax=Protopolystoma xenopodis TaxID=117903 RepID=A0A3S5ABQ3_9PLAT|nr:unnamed protein product [Protopolystoma xenopodis]